MRSCKSHDYHVTHRRQPGHYGMANYLLIDALIKSCILWVENRAISVWFMNVLNFFVMTVHPIKNHASTSICSAHNTITMLVQLALWYKSKNGILLSQTAKTAALWRILIKIIQNNATLLFSVLDAIWIWPCIVFKVLALYS